MFKKLLMASALSVALIATGCGSSVSGNITLKGDQSIVLSDSNGDTVELNNGPAVLQFKGNLFKPRLEIAASGKAAEFKIPRKLATGQQNRFYLKAEKIDQQVDLEGNTAFEPIGVREEVGLQSCYAPGWCYVGCYRYYDGRCYDRGGYPYYPPGGGYSNFCPGTQQVRRTYEDSRELLQIKFRDAKSADREILGVFDGDRGVSSRLTTVEPLGPCVTHY
ncbi:MAG: hypothetical protein A2X94_01610 [Bdellovibrionales bacterium GWB1_55_8]|nr:MAG: hypothetical protein A2X94_01610 [Bdellovibrionales bacterium GWB1_55_8]